MNESTLNRFPSGQRGWLWLSALALAWGEIALVAQPVGASIDPPSANARVSSSVTFCAVPQGAGVFTYQWRKNGVNLPGATNQCLALTNLTVSSGGSYRVGVSTDIGAIESDEATLTIVLPLLPGDDLFAAGTPISAVSNTVLGDNLLATREPGEPRHDKFGTSNSVWYIWTAPSDGIATFDTRGSAFDTILAVYTGATLTNLQEIACDDDSGGFHTSQVTWNAVAGTSYRVAIDSVNGETGTYVCHWLLQSAKAPQPTFTLQPASITALEGDTVLFRTAATNTHPPLSFQWYHNGRRLPGAVSSNLTLVKVTTPHLGDYVVTVSNAVGLSVTSAVAVLELGPVATLQSQDKIGELNETGGGGMGLLAGSVAGGFFSLSSGTIIQQRFFNAGTADRCEPPHCGVPGGASRWFALKAETDGICTLDTRGSDVDTILAVYLQNFSICTNLYEPLVDCNNDVVGGCAELTPGAAPDRSSRVSFFAAAGTLYRAVVDTVNGVHGTNVHFNVSFQADPATPSAHLVVGPGTNSALPLYGSTLALSLTTNLVRTNDSYQWTVNGRRIAGANRDTLVLPSLNYSDAGLYAIQVNPGASNAASSAAVISVVTPCGAISNGPSPFRLFGQTPQGMHLEATRALGTQFVWEPVAAIAASNKPTAWDVSTDSGRFYRVRPTTP